MSIDDREYFRGCSLPNWLEDFANKELKKGGTPFEEIKDLFETKNDLEAVEARVKELCNRVGLNAIQKTAEKKEDEIFGGLGDGHPDSRYDKEQLEKGIKVEMEHTDDPKKAKEIVKDHLEESKDFKGQDGGKYYDELGDMEDDIKDKITKAQLLLSLVSLAQELEDNGDLDAAKMVDEKIRTIYDPMLAKDKEIKKLPKKFEKYEGLDSFIQNACRTSGGFASIPAIQDRLRKEFDEDLEVKDKDLEKYIEYCLSENKKLSPCENKNDHAGEYIAIVVTEENDQNDKVFYEPESK